MTTNEKVTIEAFLYRSADMLRGGDFLVPDEMLPLIDEAREQLEQMAEQLEQNPSPPGLEPLDEALYEAYNLFAEALDLLELAVEEMVPGLAEEILIRTQDGVETLREVRRQAETQTEALEEETGLRG